MRSILRGMLTIAIVPLLATSASAKRHIQKRYAHATPLVQPYPYATERQRRNSAAFDRGGEYYESDYTAHAFGSRSWWMLQQGRGSRR